MPDQDKCLNCGAEKIGTIGNLHLIPLYRCGSYGEFESEQCLRNQLAAKEVIRWLNSDKGQKKLIEMLQQATQENDQYRQAMLIDPEILTKEVTI